MRFSLLCLTLALLSTPAFAADAPNAASLVANGNFELDSKSAGWPDGWGKAAPGLTWEAENGKHFLRLVSQTPGQTLMAYREVPIPPGTKGIEIAFRYRTAGVVRGAQPWFDARSMFHFLDAQRKNVQPEPKPMVFSAKAAAWTEVTQNVKIPEGAAALQMMPSLFQAAAGTLDLAEIRVTPLNDAALAAIDAAAAEAAEKKAAKAAQAQQKIDSKLDAQLSATGSLLANGNFETDAKGAGWPDGWGHGPSPGISWEADNGKHFIRLKQQEPGKMMMLYQIVPIRSGIKGLDLSTKYRTAGIKTGVNSWFDARMILHFLDASGKPVKPDAAALRFSAKAEDWTVASSRILVPEGAVKLEMMPSLFQVADGTLDLAEIRVAPMSDSDAEAMIASKDAAAKKLAEQTALVNKDLELPPITRELKVEGNQLVTADGKKLWLQGLCVDSMQWGPGDNILYSIRVAIDDWKANVIRLPVHDDPWFGRPIHKTPSNQEAYRHLVDQAVKLAAAKGAYLVLDLHQFGAPTEAHVAFWKDAAARYKNNPAVLFELFNEPHGISWEIWRNGGSLSSPKNKSTDVNPTENTQKMETDVSTGVQALVKAVRETGAKNMIISGGLDWSYDLTGIMNGYALDDLGGNGIMYVTHIYPWKKDWKNKFLLAADKYPIIVTEIGCPEKWEDFSFIPQSQRYPLEGWSENVLGMIQKNKLHWTGFSFNPHCGPPILKDWDYTPTPFWGVYVKEALAGKQFEAKEMR